MDWLEARWQERDVALRRAACSSCTASTAGPTSPEEDARPPGGLPRLAAGADRQRRPSAAPARHLRRADGRGLPLQQVRRPGRLRRLGAPAASWSTGCATTGAGRTRASGRCAAAGGTSSTRSSCAGWRWTAGCGWPTSAPSRPTGRAGWRPATRSTRRSWPRAGTRAAQAFVQAYGSDALDASTLLMPLVFFMAPNDPRMLSTLDAIRRPLARGRPGRRRPGLPLRPGAPPRTGCRAARGRSTCARFWLVEALTRAGRTDPARLDDARLLFEQMLGLRQPPRPVRRADRRRAARPWATSRRRSRTWR